VVRLGLEKARWGYPIICLVAYTFIGILAIAEVVPVQGLLGLLAVPLAAYAISLLFRHYRLRSIKKAMAMTIYLHLATGFLMVAGFALAL
jgi:1,4-dihydroxy-2-naphthoate octaprenyltransferase